MRRGTSGWRRTQLFPGSKRGPHRGEEIVLEDLEIIQCDDELADCPVRLIGALHCHRSSKPVAFCFR